MRNAAMQTDLRFLQSWVSTTRNEYSSFPILLSRKCPLTCSSPLSKSRIGTA